MKALLRTALALSGLIFAQSRAVTTDLPKTRLKASDPATWHPVPYRAVAPVGGVTLDPHGLFRPVMDNNIQYLLSSFSVMHMLVPFRQRAGNPHPPDDQPEVRFWDTDLRGSNAGRFLMGAGNTLRWIEHPELRRRLNELIDGIDACKEPNGYILAYPHDLPFRSEEPNYARAWLVRGLVDAGVAGNQKAYTLLRGHADWFNHWDLLPELIYYNNNSHQGHIASTLTYFSPIGKPEDLQVAEKYYLMDWWIDELAAEHPAAIWRFPLQNPHSYLITSFEAYLYHYRATGEQKILTAMKGAWNLIHDDWEHVGGSIAICESEWHIVNGERVLSDDADHPPKSYFLTNRGHTGETCGTVFWIKFNQRFQQLYPDEGKYTAEIEKSLYNVALANQLGGENIRYHTKMQGRKDAAAWPQQTAAPQATCCEGQGTRMYGSLPEYIYSVAPDGIYVNLFEGSAIHWRQHGQPVTLQQTTSFPFQPDVTLRLATAQPLESVVHVRIPGWATAPVPLLVNGQQAALGQPGTFQAIRRTWADGDTVSFTLPMALKATEYTGFDQIPGHRRYALEYGPILLAATGPLDAHSAVTIAHRPDQAAHWLKPIAGRPLCYAIAGDPAHQYVPYWQITQETFCVFPVMEGVDIVRR